MADESRHIYELQYPSPEVGNTTPGLTLIVALEGYADAGQAIDIAARHLLTVSEHHTLASFNVDELVDYRSRRPSVTIADGHIVAGENLSIEMFVLRDMQEQPYLLLSGPEPDMRWDGFTKALADLVERFHVSQTICLYAIPMTMPHTRPTVISAHANTQELTGSTLNFQQRFRVPGSAALHLERELHRRGLNVAGYTAHVPQYLAQGMYPEAALRFLQVIQATAKLEFPLQGLENDTMRMAKVLENEIAQMSDVHNDLAELEEHYDSIMDIYHREHPDAILPGEYDVPSGEDIGREFEKFLSQLSQDDNDGLSELEGHGLSSQSELPCRSDDITIEDTSEAQEGQDPDEGQAP